MVTLDVIREEMRKRLEQDKELHSVEVHANTIDEALQDAAVQLDSKVSALQYEIIERGSDGFLGMGKKPWKLRIYQDPSTIKKVRKLASDGLFAEDGTEEEAAIKDRDGLFYVHHFSSDIMLKVIPPIGKGMAVDFKDVMQEINRPDTLEVDESLVKKFVKQGTDNEYCIVGAYKHVPAGDVLISVECTKDEMKASIIVTPPALSGAEASPDSIKRALSSQGVIEQCYDEAKMNEFVDIPNAKTSVHYDKNFVPYLKISRPKDSTKTEDANFKYGKIKENLKIRNGVLEKSNGGNHGLSVTADVFDIEYGVNRDNLSIAPGHYLYIPLSEIGKKQEVKKGFFVDDYYDSPKNKALKQAVSDFLN